MQNLNRVEFENDMVGALGIDGGEVHEEYLKAFLDKHFGVKKAKEIRANISEDLIFFRSLDPASTNYDEAQILSIRRGMTAITAHRLFQELLKDFPDQLFDIEVMAKLIQKETNVEIHPAASIEVPFAIDHGHGTVVGATTRIGKRTFIYHGVTLGASKKRSSTQRRHPIVGDDVFFGNGSQVLGPSILENDIRIASTVTIRDSYIESGVHIASGLRIAEVLIPKDLQVIGFDPENLRRYWVKEKGASEVKWVELEIFYPEARD